MYRTGRRKHPLKGVVFTAKDLYEVAGEITVAWLAAIGRAPGENASTARMALELLSDQDRVSEFYKKIYETTIEAYKENMPK